MKFTTSFLTLFFICGSAVHARAETGWTKLTRDNCARLLGHLRPQALTVDNIIDELDENSRGRIEDCGAGCYEYADWSSRSIPADQAENERKVAAAYAESLLIKNEGLFLFSRYNGFDVPAWDGLAFELDTGVITAKVSLKRGRKGHEALDLAFNRAHRYSIYGGEWANLAANRANRHPPPGLTWAQARDHSKNIFAKIARWMLADDERVKTRIVLQQPEAWPMHEGLPAYAQRLMLAQPSSEVESVTIIEGDILHHIVDENPVIALRKSRSHALD